MKKIITQSIKATFLALIFGAVTVFAAPFVGPTDVPSVDNAPLPVNVSLNNQFKQGGIGISSLLVGPGSTLPGATNVSILGKLGIGSGLVFSSIPTNGISAVGMISSAQGFWSVKNISAGFNSLTPPAAAGATGAVIADRFCFSGLAGTCTTTWGGGGSTLNGLINQTVRFSGTNTPVAASNLMNDGTNVSIYGATNFYGGSAAVPNVLFLNSQPGASKVTIVTNKQNLQFWNSLGNSNASLIAFDLTATNLSNGTNQYVCADTNGKLNLCGTGPVTGGSPAIDLQINGQDNYSTTIPDSFTINDTPNLTWAVTSLGAGWTCTASNAWTGTKSANGGAQTIAVNAYGTQTFIITCVNGAQTVSDTATYTANGYYTYYADGTFNPGTHSSIAGLALTATAVGAGGGGATFDLNSGYVPSCSMTLNSAAIGGFTAGNPYDVASRNGTTSTIYNNNTAAIYANGSGGGGRPATANGPQSAVAAGGNPTNLSTVNIDPGVIITDSNGLVRGRGGEGTINGFSSGSVSCSGNLLFGISGGVGRGPIPNNNVNYTVDVGALSPYGSNGNPGAIRINW